MTRAELQTWIAYIDENGPLNLALRIDAAAARIGALFSKAKQKDLMPWPREPEAEATLEDTFALFKGLASKTTRKH